MLSLASLPHPPYCSIVYSSHSPLRTLNLKSHKPSTKPRSEARNDQRPQTSGHSRLSHEADVDLTQHPPPSPVHAHNRRARSCLGPAARVAARGGPMMRTT
eukprot:1188215-Prorocentrum_minimum.AAC.1